MILNKLSGKLALIVEDDPVSNELLNYLLKKVEMQTLRALNGSEAMKLFTEHPDIDIVLMDIKMPDLSGFELTKLMKEIRPNIPIIAQTAYALAGDRQRALAEGCDEYIKKPIKKEELFELMAKFF